MTKTHKLRAPNPDMNGVKVDGYDRVSVGEDGYFEVQDSNLVAKLLLPPWNFTVVPREGFTAKGEEAPAPVRNDTQRAKDDRDAKDLKDLSRADLILWLKDRGQEAPADISDADLLAAAELVKEEEVKKSGAGKAEETKSNKKGK